jgi:ATP-dependent Clp protease adaptor protein ClpS
MSFVSPCGASPPKQLPAPVLEPAVGTATSLAENWKVIFHNDEVTTFEFVIGALMRFFGHSSRKALELTYEVHRSGAAVVAVLPFEDAEFKQEQVTSAARGQGYPLYVSIEPDA